MPIADILQEQFCISVSSHLQFPNPRVHPSPWTLESPIKHPTKAVSLMSWGPLLRLASLSKDNSFASNVRMGQSEKSSASVLGTGQSHPRLALPA